MDVDVATQLVVKNLRAFDMTLRKLGFEPRIPAKVTDLANPKIRKEWMEKRNLRAFSYIERMAPFRVVDIVIVRNFGQLHRQRVEATDAGTKIPIISRAALIKMKSEAGRPKDQEDVRYLRAAQSLER